jgi:hypothetical protein
MVQNGKDLSPGVEQIALGLIRLADLTGDTGTLKRRRRSHQAIIERLTSTQLDEDNRGTIALEKYRHLLRAYLIERKPMLEPKWPRIQAYVLSIANALCDGNTDSRRASDFLAWSEGPSLPNDTQQGGAADVPPNAYRYKEGSDGRRVDIRLGSIHAVKGEDHLATMLLSTYFHEHSSLRILPWLLGTKANLSGAGPQDRRRLLQTYVAMTRPTHLLCLAIPRFVLGDSREYADALRAFYKQGWHVIDVGDATRPKSREK